MKDVRSKGKGVGTCSDRGKKLQVELYGVAMWSVTVCNRRNDVCIGVGKSLLIK